MTNIGSDYVCRASGTTHKQTNNNEAKEAGWVSMLKTQVVIQESSDFFCSVFCPAHMKPTDLGRIIVACE